MTDTDQKHGTRLKSVATKKEIVPDSFTAWIDLRGRKVKTLFEALFAVPGLTLVFGLFARHFIPVDEINLDYIVLVVLLIQLATISVLCFFIPKVPRLRAKQEASAFEREELHKIEEQAEHFKGLWRKTWFCWVLLYFVLSASLALKGWLTEEQLWFVTPFKNTLNNIQTVFFVMCFRELRYPTHEKDSPLFEAVSVTILIGLCELIFLIPSIPIHVFGLAFSKGVGWFSGCVGGAAIALLVGRLETKLINAPVLITTLFYFYASIQGAFPFLAAGPYLTLVFTSLAFLFKLLLFAFMAWVIQSGVLQFYFKKMLELDDKSPQERRSFLESSVVRVKESA